MGFGGTASLVQFLPQEDMPWSTARDVSGAHAGQPPSWTAVVAQPNAQTGATGYPANAPAITVLFMLRLQPPFTWKLELLGRQRASREFAAAI